MGLADVSEHSQAKPPPPPEAPGAYQKKSGESGGVIAMIDLLVKDLDKEMTVAKAEEKDAQGDYEQFMKIPLPSGQMIPNPFPTRRALLPTCRPSSRKTPTPRQFSAAQTTLSFKPKLILDASMNAGYVALKEL